MSPGEPWRAPSRVVAIALLYACLAIGPMSILSPLTAVVSAIAPMLWGLFVNGETLAPLGYAGLGIALVAVVLVGFIPGEKVVRPSLRGLLMALGAGVAIGAFLIVLDQTSDESGLVPLIVSRATSFVGDGADRDRPGRRRRAPGQSGILCSRPCGPRRRCDAERSRRPRAHRARPHPAGRRRRSGDSDAQPRPVAGGRLRGRRHRRERHDAHRAAHRRAVDRLGADCALSGRDDRARGDRPTRAGRCGAVGRAWRSR